MPIPSSPALTPPAEEPADPPSAPGPKTFTHAVAPVDPAADPPVDVVLPCLDEAAALPAVLAGLPPGWRAIVVDNGSRDGSGRIARELGAEVVDEFRRGFGAACAAGLAAAQAPVVAFCDADGSLNLADLVPLVGDVTAAAGPNGTGRPALALGRRRPTSLAAWPLHARLGNAVLAGQLRRRAGVRLRDLGPLRAAPREALLQLGLRDRRCGFPLEMVLRAAAAGWLISERDVAYRPRVGRSKVTGTVGGTVTAVRDLHRVLAEVAP
jgi:glycosyltransferase involved in cell wall biosynthesis